MTYNGPEHREDVGRQKKGNRWWHEELMPVIVKEYERQTGRKWVPGSSKVREWIDKTFNTKDKQP
jgi:hypothetical protein